MITTCPVRYATVTNSAAATVKATRGEFYGFVVVSSSSGTITVKDGGSGGVTVFTATALTAGQVVTFGGVGIIHNTDIYVSVGGTATVNVLYV